MLEASLATLKPDASAIERAAMASGALGVYARQDLIHAIAP
jgi:hypothetical protein